MRLRKACKDCRRLSSTTPMFMLYILDPAFRGAPSIVQRKAHEKSPGFALFKRILTMLSVVMALEETRCHAVVTTSPSCLMDDTLSAQSNAASGVSVACSGHGRCDVSDTCVCDTGWDSETECSDCVANHYGPHCLRCPRCGQGVCRDGVHGNGGCKCDSGWAIPPRTSPFVSQCTACDAGYFGASCAPCPGMLPVINVPCNGAGVCADGLDGNGTCTCLDQEKIVTSEGGRLVQQFTGTSCDRCTDEQAIPLVCVRAIDLTDEDWLVVATVVVAAIIAVCCIPFAVTSLCCRGRRRNDGAGQKKRTPDGMRLGAPRPHTSLKGDEHPSANQQGHLTPTVFPFAKYRQLHEGGDWNTVQYPVNGHSNVGMSASPKHQWKAKGMQLGYSSSQIRHGSMPMQRLPPMGQQPRPTIDSGRKGLDVDGAPARVSTYTNPNGSVDQPRMTSNHQTYNNPELFQQHRGPYPTIHRQHNHHQQDSMHQIPSQTAVVATAAHNPATGGASQGKHYDIFQPPDAVSLRSVGGMHSGNGVGWSQSTGGGGQSSMGAGRSDQLHTSTEGSASANSPSLPMSRGGVQGGTQDGGSGQNDTANHEKSGSKRTMPWKRPESTTSGRRR